VKQSGLVSTVKKAVYCCLVVILLSGCAVSEYAKYYYSGPKDTASLIEDSKNKNHLIRSSAVIDLGQCKEEAIGPLIEASYDSHPRVRELAFLSLAMVYTRTKDRRAAERIIEAAKNKDKSPSVRVALISSLCQVKEISPDEAINIIIGYLGDEETVPFSDYSVNKMAVDSLLRMGAGPVPHLISSLESNPGPKIKVKIVLVLAKIRDLRAIEPLVVVLKDNDPLVRNAAVEALGELEDKRATGSLLALVRDKESSVLAIGSLGKIKDEKSVEPLILLLQEKDPNIRNAAVKALGEIKDKRAVEPLIALLKDKKSDTFVIEALGTIKDKRAAEYLIQLLNKKNEELVVAWSAWALGEINDPAAAKPLVDILSDERGYTVVIKPWDLGESEIEWKISIPLNVDDALVKIGAPAVGYLKEAQSSKNNNVRKRATEILRRIEAASGVKNRPFPKKISSRENSIGAIKEYSILKGHTAPVFSLVFSPDGRYLISGSRDNTIRIWDTENFKEVKRLTGHKREVSCLALSPDGKYLASASYDLTVKIWEMGNFRELQTLKDYGDWVFSLAFSPDGKYLASGCQDNTVKIWDTRSFTLFKALSEEGKSIFSVAFSPDSRYLAAVTGDQEHNDIKIWESGNFKLVENIEGNDSLCAGLAFSPDGKYLVSNNKDNMIKFWQVAGFKDFRDIDTGGHVYCFAFSANGRYLASTGFDRTIKIWSLDNFENIKTPGGGENIFNSPPVMTLVFSPDDKFLAGGAIDNTIKIWRTDEER